jgi:mycothiol synthase
VHPALRTYEPHDRQALHKLVRHPSLAPEFTRLLDSGELDDPLRHPHGDVLGAWLAVVAGAPVGFALVVGFTSPRSRWALSRIGVIEPYRRRRLGSALLARMLEHLQAPRAGPRPSELCMSAWDPNPAAGAFADRHGFRPFRIFWTMERQSGAAAEPRWPEGVEPRPWDGSETMLGDLTATSNRAFAGNAMSSAETLDGMRSMTRRPGFRPDGLLLAYRDGRCLGFSHNALHHDHGEVHSVGVAPEARGLGLGRALLRWGVGWLQRQPAAAVRLVVDGSNQSALALYRSEGFEVTRTRRIWERPLNDA